MSEFKSFFKTVGGNEGGLCHYPTRLDTYGCGCEHDCSYCYAKSLLDFRHLWNADEPSVADVNKVKRKISKLEKGSVVRMGGMTDCFAPIERRNRVSYEAIKALNEQGVGYLIVTKSPLIATDEYMDVLDRELAHVQVSVTSTDDALAATYERAASSSSRLKAVETLQENGFDVSLRLSPYIYGYVDKKIINQTRVDKLLIEFLRVNTWVKRWFDIDFSPYTLQHGGYYHLPLGRKLQMLEGFEGKQISVCDDVPEHYEYFQNHVNANPDDCCNLA